MYKSKNHCMKCLSMKMIRIFGRSIDRISQEWMSQACHMYTNLMRATCFQTTFNICGLTETLQDFIMCNCLFSIFMVDRHLLTIDRHAILWITYRLSTISTCVGSRPGPTSASMESFEDAELDFDELERDDDYDFGDQGGWADDDPETMDAAFWSAGRRHCQELRSPEK